MKGAIYVDFDGTLAFYDGFKGIDILGPPIEPMLRKVKYWLASGETVKIFTARADTQLAIECIKDWCEANGLPRLEVTNVKGKDGYEFYDDRAFRVAKNTGFVEGELFTTLIQDFLNRLGSGYLELDRDKVRSYFVDGLAEIKNKLYPSDKSIPMNKEDNS